MHAPLYLNSRSGRPPLRIGVLLDTGVQPACFAEVLEHIARSNFARLELAVYNADAQKQPAAPQPQRSVLRKTIGTLRDKKRRRRLLFTLYERWNSGHIAGTEDPLREVDCSAYFKDVESIVVTPVTKRFVHRFPEDAIRRIREQNLDVLIRFGFNILRGEILRAARYGIWSYHHGDNDFYRGGPAYFWEVYEGNPISGAILQVLTEELDAGKVLYKGLFATYPGLSWSRNRVQPYWGASTFIIQKLHQLHEHGWERVESEVLPHSPYQGRAKIYSAPTNGQMVRWLGPLLVRKAASRAWRLLRGSRVPHWMLAVNPGDQVRLASGGPVDLNRFHWIHSPRGHFYADPFLIKHCDKPWLFFEDFNYATKRGSIVCAEVLNDGGLSKVVPVLERPYHLSYPCVFYAGDEMYMIPETRANRTVEMYRCKNFPDVWESVKVFLQAPAVDTTVCIEEGIYWFFVTLYEPRGGGLQLWLFYSTDITGDWTPHPRNPICTDIRRSRGAGAVYREGAKLVRPSQDCSGNYGRCFTLNEIVVLNQREYQERPYLTVEAPRRMIGTHSYSQLDNFEVIDGCTLLPARQIAERQTRRPIK